MGKGPQGRVSPASGWKRDPDHAVPRLGRHVHGALPQHGPRGQRYVGSLGNRQRWRAVPASAADAAPDTHGRDLRSSDRNRTNRFLITSCHTSNQGGPQAIAVPPDSVHAVPRPSYIPENDFGCARPSFTGEDFLQEAPLPVGHIHVVPPARSKSKEPSSVFACICSCARLLIPALQTTTLPRMNWHHPAFQESDNLSDLRAGHDST